MNREGDEAIIRVRDTGAGIASNMLDKVFDLFVQGQESPRYAGGGIGVGLALVKAIVQLHGGRVKAISDGAERGSEFIVSLPLAKQEVGVTMDEDSKPMLPTPPRSLQILLVENDDDIRELTSQLLRLNRHQVRTANRGTAALAELDTACPDVALIDIGLPDMSGYDVARRARGFCPPDRLALIALTGYGQPSDRKLGHEAGFDAHLTKPIKLSELDDLLASFSTTVR